MGIGATFDSTHFPEQMGGGSVTVELDAQDSLGFQWTASASAPVKNYALLAQFEDPRIDPWPAWVVETQTVPPYATAVPGWLSGSWSPLDFLGGMSGSDIVFYSGHGAPDNFLCGLRLFGGAYTTDVIPTGPDVLCPQSPNPLMDAGLESRRIDQIGSGAPPFNSTGNPPVNFVFLQACDCLQSAPWMKFLYPYAFQYGSYLEDQAVLGFACAVRLGEYWNEAGTLFSDLMSGMTVDNARTDLLSSGFHNADNDALLELRDVPVIGDTHTRTRTVYTGDNSSPGTPDWFLPLPPTVPGPTGG